MGFAAKTLILLVGAITVAGLALWGAPKLAPHLPAPLAAYLARGTVPAGVDGLIARLDALEDLRERVAALEEGGGDEAGAVAVAARRRAEENRAALDDLAARLSSIDRAAGGALEGAIRQDVRIDALHEDLAGVKAEIVALKGRGGAHAPGAQVPNAGGAIPELEGLKAAVAILQARVGETEGLLNVFNSPGAASGPISAVSTEALDATRAGLRDEITAVREAGDLAMSAVHAALREVEIRGAATELRVLLAQGLPYAGALGRIEALSGAPAPVALSAHGAHGVATMPALREAFPAAARAAIAAAKPLVEGEDPLSRVSAWLGSQVSIRPTQPVGGTSTGAVLSRIEAAIGADDGSRALAEAESLTEAASGAMADWLSRLAAKTGAEAALASYIAAATGKS